MPWKKRAAEYVKTDQLIISNGIPQNSYEEEQPQKDGRTAIMLVSKVPVFDEQQNVIGILGIYTDITERKKAEATIKASQERETETRRAVMIVAGSMEHDLRNPLVVLRMIAKTISKYFIILVKCYQRARVANSKEIN
jgi:hypothetical protein